MTTTVLVIEDNDNNRYMVRFLLEKAGIKVLEAPNGVTGVETAVTTCPDLIIVDIQLPDINGLEVTRRIRAAGCCGPTPIVALTSYAMPGDRQHALEAGCTGYLEKPITPETFIAQIQEYLVKKQL